MKIKLYYYWQEAQWLEGGGRIDIWTRELSGALMDDRVFLKSVEIEVPDCEAPSRETIVEKVVAGLQAQKQELLAETHQKVAKIEDRIREISCITFVPDAGDEVQNANA